MSNVARLSAMPGARLRWISIQCILSRDRLLSNVFSNYACTLVKVAHSVVIVDSVRSQKRVEMFSTFCDSELRRIAQDGC